MVRSDAMARRKMFDPARLRVSSASTRAADKLQRHIFWFVDVRGKKHPNVASLFPRVLQWCSAVSEVDGIVRNRVNESAAKRPVFCAFLLKLYNVGRPAN